MQKKPKGEGGGGARKVTERGWEKARGKTVETFLSLFYPKSQIFFFVYILELQELMFIALRIECHEGLN